MKLEVMTDRPTDRQTNGQTATRDHSAWGSFTFNNRNLHFAICLIISLNVHCEGNSFLFYRTALHLKKRPVIFDNCGWLGGTKHHYWTGEEEGY